MPVVPATREAEAGESLEFRRWRLQRAEIAPLHSTPAWALEGDSVPRNKIKELKSNSQVMSVEVEIQ